ncbi:hypothetical protein C8F01DRAFT_1258316 [Mycena amicta]|nr:hypothetical protein C8F01DRAFT_1258316 [Mycena amicta]
MSTPSLDSSQRAELLSSSAIFLLALLPNNIGRIGIFAWAFVTVGSANTSLRTPPEVFRVISKQFTAVFERFIEVFQQFAEALAEQLSRVFKQFIVGL